MNLFIFAQLLQIGTFDWKHLGWAFAVFSGFGVKVAYEVSEKIKRKEKVTRWYWFGNVCSIFITFVVGYHSRAIIETYTGNADAQAGLYAIVGAVGFEVFKIFYRIATNKRFWEQLIGIVMNRSVNSITKSNPTDEPTDSI